VLDRESQRSSGIGCGVAIPHARNEAISQPSIALGRSKEGIDFESLDNAPVHLVFLLATPINAGADHLKALARLARILRHRSTVRLSSTPARRTTSCGSSRRPSDRIRPDRPGR